MFRILTIAASVIGFAVAGIDAQDTHPLISEARQNYGTVKSNVIRLVERMPEEHFSFKPAAGMRSFAEAVAHVANSQTTTCSIVNGNQRTLNAETRTTKIDLVAALRESFAECDTAFETMSDAAVPQMVRLGTSTRTRSKMGLLIGMISHSNEMHGYMAVYLRLKGLVPPSSDAMSM
jgi:uncharacterized damage-inducible protein DinB